MIRCYETREEWLTRAAALLRPLFDEQGAGDYPRFRVSGGFPKGGRGKTVGQAWTPEASGDETAELFISPEMDEPTRVLDILVHELVHAVVGNEHGHRGPFKELAKALGLEGKMTATVAGEELRERLEGIAAKLGPYPHASLTRLVASRQSTRMLKVSCPECGCICRMTQKWLDAGAPTCACGNMMEGPKS